MKIILYLYIVLLSILPSSGAEEIDAVLTQLSERLTSIVEKRGLKKVTVLDFADLQNRTTELGKYIAEQLTVDLVSQTPGFSVLDRTNLRKILQEHKLTSDGLIDPENAKKLGLFAGVDALILGTIIPKKTTVSITVRIITTETAEIVGASKAEFAIDDAVTELLSKAAAETKNSADEEEEDPGIAKQFGNLKVVFSDLRIVNGEEYELTVTFSNKGKRSIWASFDGDTVDPKISLMTPNREEFRTRWKTITGLARNQYYSGAGNQQTLTEIGKESAITSIIRFTSSGGRRPSPGKCRLQADILVADVYSENNPVRIQPNGVVVTLDAK